MANTPPSHVGNIWPFWVVRDVLVSVAFYRDRLGFHVDFLGPEGDPFFCLLSRGNTRLMLKAIVPDVQAVPNHTRHEWSPWDAYVNTDDPDALAAEFVARGVTLRAPVAVNGDNLRGFEIEDPDGYVIYFGKPNQ
jgi:hypothetical protein